MNLIQYMQCLKDDPAFMTNVTCWHTLPARPARYADFPADLDIRLRQALQRRGISRLYTHQRQAIDAAQSGKNVVVVTPTASGKTLCYNLPVLNAILTNSDSRALYLFPTKALTADQQAELYGLIEEAHIDIKCFTYDGDTPAAARKAVRDAGHIVVTNPDMLHSAILPSHTKWVKLFENLSYIIIDEIHAYTGVFGGNLSNVLRRLKRICQFYGSHPRFICCSATIANPRELAEALAEEEFVMVDDNGAPAGARHMVFYNPPVVNRQLGIRRSSMQETREITAGLVKNGIQSIVFAKSRLVMEVLVKYMKELVADPLGQTGRVRGYRGGYLPTQRRAIEKALRAGEITCVVSTNALELGIDIGQLDVCVLCGYPGTIASTWQQAGRAGRRNTESLLIVVAGSSPLDQYMIQHPDYFFSRSPEKALINPNNLYILLNHLKCAAYELPFRKGEAFGKLESTEEMLSYLTDEGLLRQLNGGYYWMAQEFPQTSVSLRSAGEQNFVIIDISTPDRRVIGEMDRFTVPMLLHQYAIYMHEGRQYQVEQLDFDDKKAYVRAVDVDYYTDADLNTSMKVLDEFDSAPCAAMERYRGEVLVSSIVKLFKKIKFDTHENLGWGPVNLPEMEMQTSACWWTLPDSMEGRWSREELQTAMLGLAHLLRGVIPASLMCSPKDVNLHYHVRDPFTRRPTLYLYDSLPGGLGLADRVYEMEREPFRQALALLKACPCQCGCPGCTGASGVGGKDTLMALIPLLLESSEKKT